MRLRFLSPLITVALALGQSHSIDREIAMGAELANAMRRDNPPLASTLVQGYVARLGRQLSLAAPGANYPYTFTVIADAGRIWAKPHEPLALPGGPILIPANLILEAHDTPELAGMLAHSIAHVADRDCTPSKTRAELMQVGAIAASRSSGCWVMVGPLSDLQFQRALERDADRLAVQILAKAGFDPAAFAAYIGRVQSVKPGSEAPAFSPWPSVEARVSAIERTVAGLSPERPYSAGEDLEPIQREVRALTEK